MQCRRVLLVVLSFALLAIAVPADAKRSPFQTAKRLRVCEMPNVFYSAAHQLNVPPCCATAIGMCAGGSACPGSGICPDGKACLPSAPLASPNIVLLVADD